MRTAVWISCILSCSSLTLLAARELATPKIVPADPEAAGKELVTRLLSLKPAAGTTNSITLTNFLKKQLQSVAALRLEVTVTPSNWTTAYVVAEKPKEGEQRFVSVRQPDGQVGYYFESVTHGVPERRTLSSQSAAVSIAGSEFTLADVGMEFLRWPSQRVLVKEVCRSQSCDKLESLAPPGWTGPYVRVWSWFDIDTGGPVLVEGYDAAGRMVKEFKPNDFRKVDGQWEVEEVEISNPRTGARSIMHFDLQSR